MDTGDITDEAKACAGRAGPMVEQNRGRRCANDASWWVTWGAVPGGVRQWRAQQDYACRSVMAILNRMGCVLSYKQGAIRRRRTCGRLRGASYYRRAACPKTWKNWDDWRRHCCVCGVTHTMYIVVRCNSSCEDNPHYKTRNYILVRVPQCCEQFLSTFCCVGPRLRIALEGGCY